MKVYVYRHAMATFGKGSTGKRDSDPGINREGREQVEKVCTLFGSVQRAPGVVLTSPLKRALETAELAVSGFWKEAEVIVTESLKPSAKAEAVFREIGRLAEEDSVAMVVHYPFIAKFLRESFGKDFEVEVGNGSILGIDFEGAPVPGKGKLMSFISPFM